MGRAALVTIFGGRTEEQTESARVDKHVICRVYYLLWHLFITLPVSEQHGSVATSGRYHFRAPTLDPIQHRLRNYDDANPRQEDVASLLSALVSSPTAFSLPFPDESDNVAAKLFPIQQQVRGGLVKPDHFCALVRHIVSRSPDIDIWEAVFNIIDNLGALTPSPSSIAPSKKRPLSLARVDFPMAKRATLSKGSSSLRSGTATSATWGDFATNFSMRRTGTRDRRRCWRP